MSVYKFKVWFEDHEDINREIEIRATQTFSDLHKIIQESIGFDNKHGASFFLSDDYWRKGEEIVLREEDSNRDNKGPKKLMNKCKLALYIEDPHQKFLYQFDYAAGWWFCVELIKIISIDPKASYPRCVKSNGVAKKQYKTIGIPPVVEDDEEFNGTKKLRIDKDELIPDNEAYSIAEEEEEVDILDDEETVVEGDELVLDEEETAIGFGEEGEEDVDAEPDSEKQEN